MSAMKRKKHDYRDPPPHEDATSDEPAPAVSGVVLVFAVVALICSLIVIWLVPRKTGDTFMTMAAGKDVLDGKLGQSDDWSFTTNGQIWINQSWGTGTLFYLAHRGMGGSGLVALKATLISLMTLFLILAARRVRAGFTVGVLATAWTMKVASHFIDMRANLVGLTCLAMLIWLLYWSQGRPHRTWIVVALTTLWANMHGSFIFGLGMLVLWSVIHLAVLAWLRIGRKELIKQWPLLAATCAAWFLAAVMSPFGVTNLTQPFTLLPMFQGEQWPLPAIEMASLFDDRNSPFGGLRGFFILIGLLAAPLVAWICCRDASQHRVPTRIDPRRAVVLSFTVVLVVIALSMAIMARRFIPIALFVATPLVAFEFQWLLSHRWFAWPTVLFYPVIILFGTLAEQIPTPMQGAGPDLRNVWGTVALALLATPLAVALVVRHGRRAWARIASTKPGLTSLFARLTERRRSTWPSFVLSLVLFFDSVYWLPGFSRYYRTGHPFYPDYGLFERMVVLHLFPVGPVEFFNANGISGRVFNEWGWEGFLRWNAPQLKVFLGGRSRQVYPPEAAVKFDRLMRGKDVRDLDTLGV